MIEFKSVIEKARLIDPSGNAVEQVIEHRIDPLTSGVASINAALGEKAKAFLGGADVQLLGEMQEKSRAACPFCSVAEKGTRFPADLAGEPLADAIAISSELVGRTRERDASMVPHSVGMNFLPPGGSSVPHPHFQV